MGLAYRNLGQYQKAQESLQQALALPWCCGQGFLSLPEQELIV
ncbi:tetratricopeptide repeat protein [Allocoleopsis sp.]